MLAPTNAAGWLTLCKFFLWCSVSPFKSIKFTGARLGLQLALVWSKLLKGCLYGGEAALLVGLALVKPIFHLRINSHESTFLCINRIGLSLVTVGNPWDKRKIPFARIYSQVENRLKRAGFDLAFSWQFSAPSGRAGSRTHALWEGQPFWVCLQISTWKIPALLGEISGSQ